MTCPAITMSEGAHIEVSIDDKAGNHGTSTRTFVIDTNAPRSAT